MDKRPLAPSKKTKLDTEFNKRNLLGDRNSPQCHIKELSLITLALRWQKFVCYGEKEVWVEIMLHIILSVPLVSVPERLGAHRYLQLCSLSLQQLLLISSVNPSH